MKICPTAPQAAKARMSFPTEGCARMNARAAESSFADEGGMERVLRSGVWDKKGRNSRYREVRKVERRF